MTLSPQFIEKHFDLDKMKQKKLEGNVIDYIRKGIKSITAERGLCKSAVLSALLQTQYPNYFKKNDWAGFPKFKLMIESEPKHFIAYYIGDSRTELCIRLAVQDTEASNSPNDAQPKLSQEHGFSEYVKRYFGSEECENLRKEIITQYDESLTDDCVLRTKLIYMYHKAEAEGLLIGTKGFGVAFHTGLFKNAIDPIYFMWTKLSDETQTHLLLAESSREFREMMRTFGNRIPQQPTFDIPTFNPDLDIMPDYGHIIKERFYRIPKNIWEMLRNNPDLDEELRDADEEVLAIKFFNYLRRHRNYSADTVR